MVGRNANACWISAFLFLLRWLCPGLFLRVGEGQLGSMADTDFCHQTQGFIY